MNIYEKAQNPDFYKDMRIIHLAKWETVDDFLRDYDYFNPEAPETETMRAINRITGFYEGMGVLMKEGLLDTRLLALHLSAATRRSWEKFKPIIKDLREHWNGPRAWSEYEYLYNELMRYIEEHPELKSWKT
jgi:hypothetical protein